MAMEIDMEMNHARFDPMDAQRFDPLRRTGTVNISFHFLTSFKFLTSRSPPILQKTTSSSAIGTSTLTMGQGLCVRTRPMRTAVGGIWPDHEVVVIPLSGGDMDSESEGVSTCSTLTSTSTSTSTTDARASSPAPDVGVPPSHTREVDVYDRDDIVVTRTIIRPNPNPNHRTPSRTPSRTQLTLARMLSRSPPPSTTHSPSSSTSALPRSNPPSRPTSPVLQVLNCFSTSSAFESDGDDMHERGAGESRPVLQVIVAQTRERYEDDRAFKEIVGQVYPGPGAVITGGVSVWA
ncbi:hypothetical protein DFH29DRAFT_643066 [Suillus ampliporus]|nr:hypothetical protein DFH29DRAFT_643066 [Suillus ampliporus]